MSRKQPLDFRKEEVSYVMQRWRASDSCSLIGVGSVGKSNLLQHLADFDVQKAYMNITGMGDFKAIIIDPNMLGPLSDTSDVAIRCWAGYELMMHRLFMAFYPFEMLSQEDARQFYDSYQALQDGNNPLYAYMGLRYFELGLGYLMRRGARVVFMFDEFEDMLRYLPGKFFQTLRGLRDTYKRQLSYLTFTRAPLVALIDRYGIDPMEIEPFAELFNDSIYYVGPYNETDARRMIDNLMSRNQKNLLPEAVDFLSWATGRYAGLIRSGFRLIDSVGPIDAASKLNDEVLRRFAMRRPIRTESHILWSSLTAVERQVLKAVARITEYQKSEQNEQAVAQLVQKQLLRVDPTRNTLHIEPPVFRVYVESNPD